MKIHICIYAVLFRKKLLNTKLPVLTLVISALVTGCAISSTTSTVVVEVGAASVQCKCYYALETNISVNTYFTGICTHI